MVDASFTVAPRQRNSSEENKQIKAGKGVIYGMINPTKKSIKILMLVGQIKMVKLFTVIKTMQK